MIHTVDELLAKLTIRHWDLLLIGDGSGAGWDLGAGWACVLICRHDWSRKEFFGAMNCGTVSIGEAMPYLHALMWFGSDKGPGPALEKICCMHRQKLQVHIVTDSQATARIGQGEYRPSSNRELWAAIFAFADRYQLTWHFLRRESIDMNIYVDEKSRQSRLALSSVDATTTDKLQRQYAELPSQLTSYDFLSNQQRTTNDND